MKNIMLSLCLIALLGRNNVSVHNEVVKDVDGNEYHTVIIGNQTWMVENLKVTKYHDGTAIPLVESNSDWWNRTTAAYSWNENDEAKYKDSYGALYNWYAVKTGKLCPTGWHVPTDAEWTGLIRYLGGESVAGDKLKETGTSHWRPPNTESSNETGFTAIPGGLRYFGGFYPTGINGTWWSSTEYSTFNAWYRTMDYKFSSVDKYYYNKSTGFSVRCVRDQ